MHTALYYPKIAVTNEALLKKALFFWDKLCTIDPRRMRLPLQDPRLEMAANLVVQSFTPSYDQRSQAHVQLMSLINRRLPEWFYLRSTRKHGLIVDEKFLNETWSELKRHGLAQRDDPNSNVYWSSDAFSLLMIAVLADCCAGHSMITVTDLPDAYQTITRCLAAEVGATIDRMPTNEDRVLVTARVLSPSLDEVPLENLVSLRKREHGPDGHHYTRLRHEMSDRITAFSEEMANRSLRDDDRIMREHDFQETFNRDYADLRQELRMAGRGFVFSKEMGGLIAATAAAASSAFLASVAFVITGASLLASMRDKYRAARFNALHGHFSSYLYLSKHAHFECDI